MHQPSGTHINHISSILLKLCIIALLGSFTQATHIISAFQHLRQNPAYRSFLIVDALPVLLFFTSSFTAPLIKLHTSFPLHAFLTAPVIRNKSHAHVPELLTSLPHSSHALPKTGTAFLLTLPPSPARPCSNNV